MGKLMLNGVEVGLPDRSVTAGGVSYDNTQSGLSATDVQDSIDEVVGNGKIYYKDVAIAGTVISSYYAQINTGVDTSLYTAIGVIDGGIWDEKVNICVGRSNYLHLKCIASSYTIPSNRGAVRVLFVKNANIQQLS